MTEGGAVRTTRISRTPGAASFRPRQVRKATIEALVDTGAVTMAIPEDVALALGFARASRCGPLTLADGTSAGRSRRSVGMRIEILGRQMTCDAFVMPVGTTPLIGQIPLEGLDLIVDPGTREIRVRLGVRPRVPICFASRRNRSSSTGR